MPLWSSFHCLCCFIDDQFLFLNVYWLWWVIIRSWEQEWLEEYRGTRSKSKKQESYSPFNPTHRVRDNWRTSHMYVCLLLLAYAWFWTCVHWHVRSFFPYDFLKFSKSFWFLKFYTVWNFTDIHKLFVCPWKGQILYCLNLF